MPKRLNNPSKPNPFPRNLRSNQDSVEPENLQTPSTPSDEEEMAGATDQSRLEQILEEMRQLKEGTQAQIHALQEENERLRGTIRQSETPPPTAQVKEPKASPIEMFDGNPESVADFLAQLNGRFMIQPVTFTLDRTKIMTLLTHQKPGTVAQKWATPYMEGKNEQDLGSYGTLVKAFKKRFEDPNLRNTLVEKAYNLKQKTTVLEYVAEFELLQSRIGFEEDRWGFDFYRGLNQNIKNMLMMIATERGNYLKLKEEALAADQRWQQNKIEKETANQSAKGDNQGRQSKSTQSSTQTTTQADRPAHPNQNIPAAGQHIPPETKQARRDAGACMYCGQMGHIASFCPNKSKKAKTSTLAGTETALVLYGQQGEGTAQS